MLNRSHERTIGVGCFAGNVRVLFIISPDASLSLLFAESSLKNKIFHFSFYTFIPMYFLVKVVAHLTIY